MRFIKESRHLVYDHGLHISKRYIVMYIINVFMDIILKPFLFFYHPHLNVHKKYKVSVVACFKNEGENLKEWIEYNLLIGFDHFYLYNNNSTDNFRKVLKPYIDKGIVTLIDFPKTPVQPFCYEDCLKNYKDETEWLALIDIDEFYVPLIETNIKDWIKKWQRYPVLLVYWRMFGTNGQLKSDPSKLMVEQYTTSWAKMYGCGKCMLNTYYDYNIYIAMHHNSVARKGFLRIPPINQYGHFVYGGVNRSSNKELDIQMNHYWSKSWADYVKKQNRGDSAFVTNWHDKKAFLWHESHNRMEDKSIYRFLIQLKLNMMAER